MAIHIKNGLVIDPRSSMYKQADILVDNGILLDIGENLETPAGGQVIDAEGMWVAPGLIDLHVHFREPGFEYKENLATGAASAAKGGFTTVCCMPNTNPVVDSEIILEFIKSKIRDLDINVLQIGAITKGQLGKELANIGMMAEGGICAISEDGKSVRNAGLLKTAMQYASKFNLPVMSHCEDTDLVGPGLMNAGERAAYLGLAGISNDSEDIIVARDIMLADNAGSVHLHLCHISTEGSVRLLKEAKERGSKVTAEVTPHHFTLCDEDVTDYNTNYKMNPPLRSRRDVEIIRQALSQDIIDCIATDHAPHHYDEKNCEFASAANGIVGLETAVPLAVTELVRTGLISPLKLIEKMTYNPAKILGLGMGKGTLTKGGAADITIIDPGCRYIIDTNSFLSKGKNSPFGGREVYGKVLCTICGGRVVYQC